MRIKKLESEYGSIFENTGTATIIVDEDRIISEANTEFEKLSGYSKKEIEGKKKWTEFVAEDYLDKMRKYHKLRRDNPDSAPRNYEFIFKDKNNNLKDILITVGMIIGTQRSILSLLDITKRKKAEDALSRELVINSDLANISRKLLESAPIEDISDLVLEYAQHLTHSKFGFVGYIDLKQVILYLPP
jgi:PAS domain S-box-containing protein